MGSMNESYDSPRAEAAARLERLRVLLEQDPKNKGLLAQCADVALELGLARDAQGWIERALERAPGDPHLGARLASVKLALGDAKGALELLEPLAKAHQSSTALRYNLGYALVHAGRHAEAKDVLLQVVEQPDAPGGTRHLLVRALHYLGEVKPAIEQALKHAETRPGDAAMAGMLGLLYLDANDFAAARRWSEKALALQPLNLDALLASGSVALGDEDEDRAKETFERAAKASPANGRAWLGLGLAQMMKFDVPGARKHFEQALANMPEHIGTWHALAWCQIMGQDLPGAQASFERALAIDHNFGETHGGLGVLAAFQGKWEEARHHAKRALALDPQSFSGRLVHVLELQRAGKPELARQIVERGMKSYQVPGGGSLADALGRMMRKRPPAKS
jgi:tetratricopeptide (TPR) repeat protein